MKFSVAPEYLGKLSEVKMQIIDGVQFVKIGDSLKEVVIADKFDLAKVVSPFNLQEGVYVVGTGNNGCAAALFFSGLIYTAIMVTSSFTMKYPHSTYSIES